MDKEVYTAKSSIHGKGVYAAKPLPKGTLLTCDVLLIHKSDTLPDYLLKYTYPWDNECACMCIGFGSYFNHSETPSAIIKYIDKANLIKYFELLRDVKQDEELTIKYPKDTVWFYKLT